MPSVNPCYLIAQGKRALLPILSGITAFTNYSKKLRNYQKFMKLAQLSTLEKGKAVEESLFNRVSSKLSR